MKRKLMFFLPLILLLGFLAFKPPALGRDKGDVVVTPTATVTPSVKPHLRDFDDEGNEPGHSLDEEKSENEDDD